MQEVIFGMRADQGCHELPEQTVSRHYGPLGGNKERSSFPSIDTLVTILLGDQVCDLEKLLDSNAAWMPTSNYWQIDQAVVGHC